MQKIHIFISKKVLKKCPKNSQKARGTGTGTGHNNDRPATAGAARAGSSSDRTRGLSVRALRMFAREMLIGIRKGLRGPRSAESGSESESESRVQSTGPRVARAHKLLSRL